MSICLAQNTESPTAPIWRTAAGLLAQDVARVEPIGGGGNSRVYRVVAPMDGATRSNPISVATTIPAIGLALEFAALQFLWGQEVDCVPQPLAMDRQELCAVYEFVAGRKIKPAEIAAVDIEAAVQFVDQLRALAREPASARLPLAAEAFFSGPALLANIQSRLDRLLQHQADPAGDRSFHEFMEDAFLPAWVQVAAWSRSHDWYDRELPPTERTLSPSDFGFHNAICRGKRPMGIPGLRVFRLG